MAHQLGPGSSYVVRDAARGELKSIGPSSGF